jgi:hypothetical protein
MTDRESDVSSLIARPNIIVADKTKSMVQKTRGHASPPLIGNLQQFPFGVVCPFFSTKKSTQEPDEPFFIHLQYQYHIIIPRS